MRKGQHHSEETKRKISEIVLCGLEDGSIPHSTNTFEKGCIPWNKGKEGIHLNPASEFKPGEKTMENHPSWKGGVQMMTHDCIMLTTAPNQRERRPRVIYEQEYGEIPHGCVIFHLDGDMHNDNPENLVAVTRAQLVKLNQEKARR
jgi:hypothetical protein